MTMTMTMTMTIFPSSLSSQFICACVNRVSVNKVIDLVDDDDDDADDDADDADDDDDDDAAEVGLAEYKPTTRWL
jgi:hypothetical protein